MALTNPCFKTKLVSFVRGGPVEKREGEKKRKKRRGRRGIQAKIKPKRYGNYLEYGFSMDHMEFKA